MTAPNQRERILPRLIDEEVKESFINYSMSVIVSRALPDVRDGLKPVHRRILYAMNDLGLVPGRPYKNRDVVCDVIASPPHATRRYDAWCAWCRSSTLRYPRRRAGDFGSPDAMPRRRTYTARSDALAMRCSPNRQETVDTRQLRRSLTERRLPAAVRTLVTARQARGRHATNIPATLREIVAGAADHRQPDATTRTWSNGKRSGLPTGGFIYGRAASRITGAGAANRHARAAVI